MNSSRTVLWWGRFDHDYSRNRVLRQAFRQMGWDVVDFRPRSSITGDIEARFSMVARPDLLWVPTFRQRDVAAAKRWADRMSVPLVFDPLISAYDKQVNERRLMKSESLRARRLLRQERKLFQSADFLVADTHAHAEYFHSDFSVPVENILVVPVGAEEGIFNPLPESSGRSFVEALFYGTFIDLQGPLVIVEAASLCKDKNIVWTMLGAGPLLDECKSVAGRLKLQNIRFESWVPYDELPERIARADILLGAFGVSSKASRVIPNKVYQSLASGRPVITRESSAYPPALASTDYPGLVQIEAGNPDRLIDAVSRYVNSEDLRRHGGENARHIYEEYFSCDAIASSLKTVLQKTLL